MNIVYLVLFAVTSNGITSQAIPQANMAQCWVNAKHFNAGRINNDGYIQTQAAVCIAGIK